ncbi:hypothetical protein [Citrobacter sp. wls718]|uniref:hypothetical protein n=1 Tax=Citrobacter sp. wls718 TaxID=2576418 RepID=UPI000E047BA8|nr:hypothetical protein [Citrobacter sp. wls718]TKU26451.1 hypothetical protein FDW95_16600 [Citrobacter sp. wls718]STE16821.1 putative prophage DNA binding protein [Escherichia coli]
MIDSIKTVLSDKGEMTCLQLVSATGTGAPALIQALRKAVARGELRERNGYYDILRSKAPATSRRSFPWVEGTEIPRNVQYLASGPRSAETVFVLVELDAKKQLQGWPQFERALIDVRMGHFQCARTGQIVTRHVLRYLPIDMQGVA